MAVEFVEEPDLNVEQYFVDANLTDPTMATKVGGLDQEVDAIYSITQFLTLPTVIRRVNPKNRDPIIDFTKSYVHI